MTPIDDRITHWLTQLERELRDDDPALRHDAMADAREHLVTAREELPADAGDEEVGQLLADYGEPSEVAESYRAADRLVHGEPSAGPSASTAATAPVPVVDAGEGASIGDDTAAAASTPLPRTDEPVEERTPAPAPSWFGVVRDPDAWAAVLYMLLALPLGIAWFTWTVTAGAVSGSLLVLIVGIPLVLAFLASVRGIALLDGRIIETLLGERMPRRSWRHEGDDNGFVARLKYWVSDRRTWSSIAYLLTMLPLGIAYFVAAVTIGAVSLAFITAPISLLIAAGANDVQPESWSWPLAILLVPAGALGLLGLLHLARAVGAVHGAYAKAMLVGGEGASRRRRPVSIGGSAGRALAFLAAGAAMAGIIAGIGTAIARASTEEVTRQVEASDVEVLDIDVEGADVSFVVDPSLDPGEVRVDARVRVSDDDADQPEREELRIEQSGSTATVLVQCDVSVWFLDGCESDVSVHVPEGGDIELVGDTSSGDVDFAAPFAAIDFHTGSGELEGILDARRVLLDTGSGDIDVALSDAAERVDLDTGSGDVSVEAPNEWALDVETGSGDEDLAVPTDSSSDHRMRIRTGSGDVEVEPGAGSFDDDRDEDDDRD